MLHTWGGVDLITLKDNSVMEKLRLINEGETCDIKNVLDMSDRTVRIA